MKGYNKRHIRTTLWRIAKALRINRFIPIKLEENRYVCVHCYIDSVALSFHEYNSLDGKELWDRCIVAKSMQPFSNDKIHHAGYKGS